MKTYYSLDVPRPNLTRVTYTPNSILKNVHLCLPILPALIRTYIIISDRQPVGMLTAWSI